MEPQNAFEIELQNAYATLQRIGSLEAKLDTKGLANASEALRLVRRDDPKQAAKLLDAMRATLDEKQLSELILIAGREPGGCNGSTTHTIDLAIVFNTLKRTIGFSELVRAEKTIKGALEKSVEKAAKLAFQIFIAKETSGGGAVAEILEKLSDLKIQRAKLPMNKLGMKHARTLYQEIIGELHETDEYVTHKDPPASMDLPLNTSRVGDTAILSSHSDAPNEDANSEPDSVKIIILRYSQTKHWFKEALLESDELRPEREDL